jgi:GR25 family glycosyltransferase involved in LPS biosynthesis
MQSEMAVTTVKPLAQNAWRIDEIPAYCITLERRPDRWRRFQDQVGVRGMPRMRRFFGVDGKTLDIRTDPRVAIFTKRNILLKTRRSHEELDSVGGVGCALSHIALWQWMVDNNEEMMLVMEDDAVVPPDFVARANALIERSPTLSNPSVWDIWHIGARWDVTTPMDPPSAGTGLVRPQAFFLLHAYVITKKYAEKMLAEVFPIQSHIDFWMSYFATIHKRTMVATEKLKLVQYERVSTDIQTSTVGSPICDIPTDYWKTHRFVTETDHMLGRAAEVGVVLLGGYLLYKAFLAKSG